MYFLKKITIIAIICAILYTLLGYHFIIIDNSVKMLKKSTLTLKYTIYSTKGKSVEKILSVPELWDDNIGELLVKEGKMSGERLQMYKDKLDEDNYSH